MGYKDNCPNLEHPNLLALVKVFICSVRMVMGRDGVLYQPELVIAPIPSESAASDNFISIEVRNNRAVDSIMVATAQLSSCCHSLQ